MLTPGAHNPISAVIPRQAFPHGPPSALDEYDDGVYFRESIEPT
jgi:hypothetical protein